MKSVAGRLRLDLAQYRELEAFSAFGSDLDKASKAQLERGARLVELLKQPQYTPYPVERQVVSIWAGTSGAIDDVPVEDISKFEREFLDYVGRQHKGIYDAILSTARSRATSSTQLENAIADFKKTFETTSGEAIGSDKLEVKNATTRPTTARRRHRRRRRCLGRSRSNPWVPSFANIVDASSGAVDEEDHARDGAHRRVADRQGAATDRGLASVRRGDHRRRAHRDAPKASSTRTIR